MSRRPANPATDRAAQNQQILKNLVKLEGNKSCADCKRNKHPRWASWNLGVFVCIRCSGIHRGMGTHISRVKSVDLDAWTDEQMKSILQWGNSRANKKIENFIRTKYESKRWVMDGPMPDPASLDGDGDEDVPLQVVRNRQQQQQQQSERSMSNPASSSTGRLAQPPKPSQTIDLFGPADVSAPRPRTTEPNPRSAPPPAGICKSSKPADTLLGLDFLGPSTSSTAGKTANDVSASRNQATSSRPDLKQSILSLYASAPRQAAPATAAAAAPRADPAASAQQPLPEGNPSQQAFGGLSDAFGGLSFATPSSSAYTQPPQASPFSQLAGLTGQKGPAAAPKLSSPSMPDGGFFGSGSKPVANAVHNAPFTGSSQSAAFGKAPAVPTPASATRVPTPSASQTTEAADFGSLLDMSAARAPTPPPKPVAKPATTTQQSVFNLSAPLPAPQTTSTIASKAADSRNGLDPGWALADAWGSNDAWKNGNSASTISATTTTSKPSASLGMTASTNDLGWGGSSMASAAPSVGSIRSTPNTASVSADEDFGGWASAVPVTPTASTQASSATAAASKPTPTTGSGGFGGSDDLFSNVWE
ncbi:MAG: hypothetical protein M1815_003695 [Lichina confinis]|nr:MAG: hypothetical protein M1815_003695 [Lichina confinis]